jgi:CBS domain-containing protein
MQREPIILLLSALTSANGSSQAADAVSLENALRRRYVEGYRIMMIPPEGEAAETLRPLREQGEQIALLVYEQHNEGTHGALFLDQTSALYPDARRLLVTDTPDSEAAMLSVNLDTIDHYLVKPFVPAEDTLYPVLDELLAEWRASVDMPFMRVRGIMTVRTVRVRIGDTLHRAAEIIALSGVGDLMVIDDDNNFVGVLSVGDVLRAAMPDIEEIMGEGGTLEQAFRLFLRKGSELRYKPIEPIIIRNPLVVDPDDHVAKAATLMIERNIHRLPVVKDGRLLGTVGRTDICQAVVGTL